MNKDILKIPKDWLVKRLKQELIEEIYRYPTFYNIQFTNRGIGVLKVENITKDGFINQNLDKICYISEETNKRFPKTILKEDDLIMAVRGATIGKIAIVTKEFKDFNINANLIKIRINKKILLPNFFWNYMNSSICKKLFNQFVSSTSKQTITVPSFLSILIPIPSISEQQKIASIFSNVDDIIIKTEKIINQLQLVKKGLMQRLFTEGIGHNEFKETILGKIPKDWDIIKLENVIKIYDNERIPLSQTERNERKGNFPYCGANGIIDYINNYLFDGEYVLLAEDGGSFEKYEQSAYIMGDKFWVNNHAHVLQAIAGKTTNLFLMYCLNYLNLTPYTVGSTRIKLNQGDLKNIKIMIPKIEEQIKISNILKNNDDIIKNELSFKENLTNIKKGLMQDLLTGKKRVKLEN